VSYSGLMLNFLIVYNRRTGAQNVREFAAGLGREAIRARFASEREHRGDRDIEVVVLTSESRDALERTHSRYFKSFQELTAA
jgi:hypothetical protein